ncbi:hypothetical protein EMIHUDRAFT_442635 [Emiliania huxleyi CCMP1516]|uniref:Uncharacterized protein n=2 Tax=Emiliania huxleyi TaxID=2903 RepID=A0A0D3K2G2_EMIH1|nr:hypothetical protein EMIHUDRAFT_442635 [Emiliania huxleyi CCMP1516]EOD29947.1 hypothetical protein EMIHUDRAFT_442635 [Emiliania huxleyi CCMP1516]|eukprot:XP_005782376.1 hypothetical protein EMIHUDRAFT_442635 [Emiliania huxleyi CCMP1516]
MIRPAPIIIIRRLCHDCPRRCVHRRRPQRPAKAGARASPLGPDCLGMPRRAHGLGPRKGRRTHRPELLLRGPPLDKRGPLERRRPPPLAVRPLPGLVSGRGAAHKEGSTPRSDERARPSAGQGGPAAREEREGLEGRCPPLAPPRLGRSQCTGSSFSTASVRRSACIGTRSQGCSGRAARPTRPSPLRRIWAARRRSTARARSRTSPLQRRSSIWSSGARRRSVGGRASRRRLESRRAARAAR